MCRVVRYYHSADHEKRISLYCVCTGLTERKRKTNIMIVWWHASRKHGSSLCISMWCIHNSYRLLLNAEDNYLIGIWSLMLTSGPSMQYILEQINGLLPFQGRESAIVFANGAHFNIWYEVHVLSKNFFKILKPLDLWCAPSQYLNQCWQCN